MFVTKKQFDKYLDEANDRMNAMVRVQDRLGNQKDERFDELEKKIEKIHGFIGAICNHLDIKIREMKEVRSDYRGRDIIVPTFKAERQTVDTLCGCEVVVSPQQACVLDGGCAGCCDCHEDDLEEEVDDLRSRITDSEELVDTIVDDVEMINSRMNRHSNLIIKLIAALGLEGEETDSYEHPILKKKEVKKPTKKK